MGTNRTTFGYALPLIESGKVYRPDSIARRISNMDPTPEGTLRSVRGPCRYEIHSGVTLGRIFGLFHASTLGGANDVLLVRAGDSLYRHTGWNRTWEVVRSGLNNENRQTYPDVFVSVGGRVVWTNGVDRPRIIDVAEFYGAQTHPLGFERGPSPPTAFGPSNATGTVTTDDQADYPPNSFGYSRPGRIGTIGDENSGQNGALQAGAWYWVGQWEDDQGNLSPLSAQSNVVIVQTQSVWYPKYSIDDTLKSPYFVGNVTDDLTHAFMVKGMQAGPEHARYYRLGRTRDTMHFSSEVHLVGRFPLTGPLCYPDNVPDGYLAGRETMKNWLPVPHFRIACEYQGRLVIANTSANPGIVHISEPLFPGTFDPDLSIIPDSGGAEITGLATIGGELRAFTARSSYAIILDAEGVRSEPRSRTVGCVAPLSIQALDDGSAMWLGRDGLYREAPGSEPERVSDENQDLIGRINPGRVGRAVSVWDPTVRQYMCAVPLDSSTNNDTFICYDPARQGIREQKHGTLTYGALCITNDDRRMVLGGARGVLDATPHDVLVLNHENRAYTPPAKKYRFYSGELRMDPGGMRKFGVRTLYLGFIECEAPGSVNVRTYRDGRIANVVSETCKLVDVDFRRVGTDGSVGIFGTYGTAIIGTDTFRTPKLFWRQINVAIDNVTSFRFELDIDEPAFLHIQGIAFDALLQDKGGSRVPLGTD